MMNNATEPTGTLEVALSHTKRLLETNAAMAAEQAEEILKVAPNHPVATLLLGIARRRGGDAPSCCAVPEYARCVAGDRTSFDGERRCTGRGRGLRVAPQGLDPGFQITSAASALVEGHIAQGEALLPLASALIAGGGDIAHVAYGR
jgi:hypothetical protein